MAASVAAAVFALSACARDSAVPAPLPASPTEARPDVSARAVPPAERPDVLVVEIEEEPAIPATDDGVAQRQPYDSDTENSGELPTYRTAASPGPSLSPQTNPIRRYTVRPGDWLMQISREQYGSPAHARAILEANRDQIVDPDHLVPGQVLTLP